MVSWVCGFWVEAVEGQFSLLLMVKTNRMWMCLFLAWCFLRHVIWTHPPSLWGLAGALKLWSAAKGNVVELGDHHTDHDLQTSPGGLVQQLLGGVKASCFLPNSCFHPLVVDHIVFLLEVFLSNNSLLYEWLALHAWKIHPYIDRVIDQLNHPNWSPDR